MVAHNAHHPTTPNETASARVLAIKQVRESEVRVDTVDIAALDLSDDANWTLGSILLQAKFLCWLHDNYPAESHSLEHGTIAVTARGLFDEFMIEQASIIGLRVLFFPTALLRLARWAQEPDLGRERWRRLAKNIQNGLDGKRVALSQKGIVTARRGLIEDLKLLRRLLLAKKAASLAWNLRLHLNNVKYVLKTFTGEILPYNEHMFLEFIQVNNDLFKNWLLPSKARVADALFANEFIAYTHGYKSGESARQAIQKISRRTRRRKST